MKRKRPLKVYCLYIKKPIVNGRELLFVAGYLKQGFERFKKDNPEWEKEYAVREV